MEGPLRHGIADLYCNSLLRNPSEESITVGT